MSLCFFVCFLWFFLYWRTAGGYYAWGALFVLAYGAWTLRWAYGHSTILAARETSVGNGLDRSAALHLPWGDCTGVGVFFNWRWALLT